MAPLSSIIRQGRVPCKHQSWGTTTGTEDHIVIPTSKEVKEQMSSLDIYVTCISVHCSITEIAGLLDPDVVVREYR